eukprot:m.3527 g.3527  ORF g.3527 m.3527 type:complete len:63 (+) comp4212_c0_seq1:117-305(+)
MVTTARMQLLVKLKLESSELMRKSVINHEMCRLMHTPPPLSQSTWTLPVSNEQQEQTSTLAE